MCEFTAVRRYAGCAAVLCYAATMDIKHQPPSDHGSQSRAASSGDAMCNRSLLDVRSSALGNLG